jgi:hypothetical protein
MRIDKLRLSSSFLILSILIIIVTFSIIIYYISKKNLKEFFSSSGSLTIPSLPTIPPIISPIISPIILNSEQIFKAPVSLTKINESQTIITNNDIKDILNRIAGSKSIVDGNVLEFPSFFHASEKWPGCLPRPLFQGSCGSCWGFAAVTVLSSRFYIETCGNSGCQHYPQINFGSLNNVNFNLNEIYKFKKLYLTDVFKNIDTSDDSKISLDEWNTAIMDYQKIFSSQASPYIERHNIAQILVYVLNFQSLGSIDLTNKEKVKERASEAFYIWLDILAKNKALIESKRYIPEGPSGPDVTSNPEETPKDLLDLKEVSNLWLNEPITLSAEKIISCCNNCMKLDFISTILRPSNPACMGSTLDEAWSMLRESGTTTVDCIGYNLDAWTEGSYTPSCKEVQGPNYSFCSGYTIDKSNFQLGDREGSKSIAWTEDIDKIINNYENSGINPIAIPSTEKNVPWIDPQLFRFRAKNVYKVNPTVKSIQREILERGPVTSGFTIYPDFQYEFGTNGGQLYKSGTNPLGSSERSLIYMWNGKGSSLGGHAITIVGWGSFKYRDNNNNNNPETFDIPYWICLNSWGQKWGTSGLSLYNNRNGLPSSMKSGGYFWIIRGLDMCSIESNVIVGQPDIGGISYPGVPSRYGWGLPNPSAVDVTFVKQKTGVIDLGNSNYLEYKNQVDGGGSFTNRITADGKTTWLIESMTPPSPFTLFWDDSRPIYCLGRIVEKLSEFSTDNFIKTDNDTINVLKNIIKIQQNPLLVIDDEQLQLLSISEKGIKVNRGVNNSYLSRHNQNSVIKVIPFKELSIPVLDKFAKACVNSEQMLE